MISKKYSGTSILLIIAILFSLVAVIAPAAPVQASGSASCAISAVYGTGNVLNTGPACVSSTGTGSLQVTFTDNISEYCKVYMQQGSNTPIGGQDGTPSAGVPTTYTLPVAGATTGYYDVYVLAGGVSSARVLNAVYIDNSTPSVSVSTVNLCWPTSTSETINWSATIPGGIPGKKFSTVVLTWNGTPLTTYTNVAQTTNGTYTFTSPSSTTSGAIGISATSNAGTTASYTFPTTISVLAAGYIYPNNLAVSGSSLACGTAATITCNVINAASANYYYNLVLNNGTSTQNITPNWVLASSSSGISYNWTVPSVSSSSCTVTIQLRDCAGNLSPTLTSSTFAITCGTPPTVTITSPVSGTVWYAGSSDNISWVVNDPLSSNVHTCQVFYSTNDNVTGSWTQIVLPVYNSGTSYYVTWPIPASINSTNCEIHVTAQYGAGPMGEAYSSIFTINQITTAPTVAVVSPASTSSWQAGSTQTIGWTCVGSPSTALMDYKIYLVQNGSIVGDALSYRIAQAQCPSTACTFNWQIPSDLAAGAYTIRVVAYYIIGPGPQESSVIGQADSPLFNITASSAPCASSLYSIHVYPGWNLVSLQAMPINADISSVLSNISSNVVAVYYLPPQSTTWQNYVPAAGVGTLTQIADGKAYWIQMATSYTETDTANGDLKYTGRKCPCGGSTPLQAYVYQPGWNMVGFKSTIQQPVSTYLYGNCGTQYASPIQGYAGSPTGGQMISLNCSENMTPGMGYWVYFGVATGVSAGCK